MKVLQSGIFSRTVKKLHANEKKALDRTIKTIIDNPELGSLKIGDLSGVRVFKFKVKEKQYLLGYRLNEDKVILTLLALGSHENFYRDMKKQ